MASSIKNTRQEESLVQSGSAQHKSSRIMTPVQTSRVLSWCLCLKTIMCECRACVYMWKKQWALGACTTQSEFSGANFIPRWSSRLPNCRTSSRWGSPNSASSPSSVASWHFQRRRLHLPGTGLRTKESEGWWASCRTSERAGRRTETGADLVTRTSLRCASPELAKSRAFFWCNWGSTSTEIARTWGRQAKRSRETETRWIGRCLGNCVWKQKHYPTSARAWAWVSRRPRRNSRNAIWSLRPSLFLRVIEWLRNYAGSSLEWAVTVTAAENLRWFSLCKTFYLQFKQAQLTRFVRNQI